MDLITTGMVIVRRCVSRDASSQCYGFTLALLSLPSPWQCWRQHLPQSPWRALSRYMEPRSVVRQLSFVINLLNFKYSFSIIVFLFSQIFLFFVRDHFSRIAVWHRTFYPAYLYRPSCRWFKKRPSKTVPTLNDSVRLQSRLDSLFTLDFMVWDIRISSHFFLTRSDFVVFL